MLTHIYTKASVNVPTQQQRNALKSENIIVHPKSEREYRIIVLDAEDSLDVIVQYPDDSRECVWSLNKDADYDADPQ